MVYNREQNRSMPCRLRTYHEDSHRRWNKTGNHGELTMPYWHKQDQLIAGLSRITRLTNFVKTCDTVCKLSGVSRAKIPCVEMPIFGLG